MDPTSSASAGERWDQAMAGGPLDSLGTALGTLGVGLGTGGLPLAAALIGADNAAKRGSAQDAHDKAAAAKAASDAALQTRATLEEERESRAYSTQFDAIGEAARGMRRRYAGSLGYNPYFIR